MKTLPNTRILLTLAALPILVSAAQAQTYTWLGGTDFDWTTAANWSPEVSTGPGWGTTAEIGNTDEDRTIIYNSTAAWLRNLNMTQSSAFINALDVRKNLTVSNEIILGASNGGTTRLAISPVDGSITLSANGGIVVNEGGELLMNFYSASSSTSRTPTIAGGNVTIAGGQFLIGPASAAQTSGSAVATISNELSISSGSIIVNNNRVDGQTGDIRLIVNSNFTATGGELVVSPNATGGQIMLRGETNVLSNFSITPAANITLWNLSNASSGDQTLLGLPATTGTIMLRGKGIKTLGTENGATIGSINFNATESGDAALSLKLASNLTSANGTRMIEVSSSGASAGRPNDAIGVDANGYTLDMSGATNSSSATYGANGVWKPNNKSSHGVTNWSLSSSVEGGRIRARGFDFNTTNVNVTVGDKLTLEASGGNGTASHLGSGDALHAESVFEYSGGASADQAATLASGRNIGKLYVSDGALAITGAEFTAVGGLHVAADGLLDMTSTVVSAPSTIIGINGENSGTIKVGSDYVYTGDLIIDITAFGSEDTGSYKLFDIIGDPGRDHFGSVTLSGIVGLTLTRIDSEWSVIGDGYSFSFSEATGNFQYTIPEPTSTALLTALAAGAGLFCHLRRKGGIRK